MSEFSANTKLQTAFKKTIVNVTNTAKAAGIPPLLDSQVTLNLPSGRRLLSTATVTYTITLTPAQASAAPSAAGAIAASIAAGNSTFVSQFVSQAEAVGVASDALTEYLTASGTTPTVTQGTAQFSFVVADTTGPTVMSYDPVQGATGVDRDVQITLTFSEGVQAGTGNVILANDGEHGTDRYIDIRDSDKVSIVANTVTIRPRHWFPAGTVTVSIPYGVITDDAHSGSSAANPFGGLTGGAYHFQIVADSHPAPTAFLDFGIAPHQGGCSYTLTHPWYNCHDFTECTLFIKPDKAACGSLVVGTGGMEFRKVTMAALRRIADTGLERNGGDGRDTILNFGGGQVWPERLVAEFG